MNGGLTVKLLRPMAGLGLACAALDVRTNVDIIRLIESGVLRWAWNIARVGCSHREVRILVASLAAAQARTRGRELPEPGSLAEVLCSIFPEVASAPARAGIIPTIPGKRVGWALNCDSGHVINLLRDGTLKAVSHIQWGRGRGRSPCLEYASVAAFLKERLL